MYTPAGNTAPRQAHYIDSSYARGLGHRYDRRFPRWYLESAHQAVEISDVLA